MPQISSDELNAKVQAQADKVRKVKAEKADKTVIDAEVKTLLALKAEFKQATGKDWVAGAAPVAKPVSQESGAGDVNTVLQKIAAQGDKVRDLKAKKADKATVDAEVKVCCSVYILSPDFMEELLIAGFAGS